jgi:hypothetical protein
MSRLLIIAYIVFCFEIGVFLFVLPWVSLWGKNYFVEQYPLFASIVHNYFFRGAISGLGLADVWMAFYELWRLRRQLGFVGSRPPQ